MIVGRPAFLLLTQKRIKCVSAHSLDPQQALGVESELAASSLAGSGVASNNCSSGLATGPAPIPPAVDENYLLSVLQNGSTGRNPTFFKVRERAVSAVTSLQ